MSRKARFILGLLVLPVMAYIFCPKPQLLDGVSFSTAVYDRTHQLLRLTLAEDDRYRLYAGLGDISPLAVDATVLYEDAYFYRHPGVNPASVFRAFWQTYIKGGRPVGASTISMQLARMVYGIDSRSIGGKLIQILRALQIERHYSKREILEAYLNLAPYGGNIEGIAAASFVYFGKPAARLSLPEALALSVIPQNPQRRMPTTASGYQSMQAARLRLFARWLEVHREDADKQAMLALPLKVTGPKQLPFAAPHFVNMVLEKEPSIQGGGYATTLDLKLQHLLERHIGDYIDRKKALGIRNAAALLVDYRSMEIRALAGSADFFNDDISGQVNGVLSRRSPGSALKPLIYALAMDQGLIHPMSLLTDAPKRFGAYTPENFDRGFMGPVLARDALIYSRNVPAVHLMLRLAEPSFYGFLQQAGIKDMREEVFYGLALALGGFEVSMKEVVRLYAMLANLGELRPMRVLKDAKPANDGVRLLSPEASFLALDMLKANPWPASRHLPGQLRRDITVHWKTGTSYAFRDAWAVGVFGPYVLAVWVGNFDGSGNPSLVGRKAAAPLFFSILQAVTNISGDLKYVRVSPQGLNLEKVRVCAPTGDLPGRYCPRTEPSWFIPGKSPIRVSNIHRAVRINKHTGLRSCSNDSDQTVTKVYEFWSSNLLKLFREAGITRRTPPAFEPGCSMDVASSAGIRPKITSPGQHVNYAVRAGRLERERIAFAAVTDADVTTLYWFMDGRYLGRSARGEPFFWKPEPIEGQVRVVDDHGRAAARPITVRLIQ